MSGVTAAAEEEVAASPLTRGEGDEWNSGSPSHTAHLDSQPLRANTFRIHFQRLDFRLF